MSIDEFLDKLRDTPRDWIVLGGKIRRGPNHCCPITAVDPAELNCLYADFAAYQLGLSPNDRNAIKVAADYVGTAFSAQENEPRKALLVACGFSTT